MALFYFKNVGVFYLYIETADCIENFYDIFLLEFLTLLIILFCIF